MEYKWQPDSNLKSGTLQAIWHGLTTTYKINDYPTLFKGHKAYFGFTGATGWESVKQAIEFIDFKNPGPALISEKKVLNSEGHDINHQMVGEGETLNYAIEATNDNGVDETPGGVFADVMPAAVTYVPGSASYRIKDSAGVVKKQIKLSDAAILKNGKIEYTEQAGLAARTKGELDFNVKVNAKTGGQTIENVATVYDFMGLGRATNQVTNQVALAKIGPVTQTVADITAGGQPDSNEIAANRVGDQIRYIFKTKIEGDTKATLPGIDLTSAENAADHQGAGGRLDANSVKDYPQEYRLNGGNWQPLPHAAEVTPNGIQVTILPEDALQSMVTIRLKSVIRKK